MGAVKSTKPKPIVSKNPFLKPPVKLISDELTNAARENYRAATKDFVPKTKKRSKKG